MVFGFRRAEEGDLPVIWELIREAKARVPSPDWFETEDAAFAGKHIAEEGFTILVESGEEHPAVVGLMMVRLPGGAADNLGTYLPLDEEEMGKVAHLEIAVVAPEAQGNALQYRLFCVAEEMLRERGYRYLMATVHPENRYSLVNMEKLGMKCVAEVKKYGGLRRFVMVKSL